LTTGVKLDQEEFERMRRFLSLGPGVVALALYLAILGLGKTTPEFGYFGLLGSDLGRLVISLAFWGLPIYFIACSVASLYFALFYWEVSEPSRNGYESGDFPEIEAPPPRAVIREVPEGAKKLSQ